MDHLALLQQFDKLTKTSSSTVLSPLDEDIFLFRSHPGKIDWFISCCIHGNEVSGLSIVNQLLTQLLAGKISTKLNLAFSLGNRAAVQANQRQTAFDLNRCFVRQELKTAEDRRARSIETAATGASAIIDLHQTTTESLSPFFILRKDRTKSHYLKNLQLETWPVILYLNETNFSKDGSGFSAFGLKQNIPFITLELGVLGIQPVYEKKLIERMTHFITTYSPQNWEKMLKDSSEVQTQHTFYQEDKTIAKTSDTDTLIENLANLSLIAKGTVFGEQQGKALIADKDYYALFPKYGNYRKTAAELIRLMIKIS